MTQYSVSIEIDQQTLPILMSNAFTLYAFLGVNTPNPSGAMSTVWSTLDQFLTITAISWDDEVSGYFSNTPISNGTVVDTSNQKPLSPGDVMTLSESGTTSVSSGGGAPNSFTLKSEQSAQWSSGLSVKNTNQGVYSPTGAFPQLNSADNMISPSQKLLLFFSQGQYAKGTVIETAIAESISFMLSANNPTASVRYDIQTGWDIQGNPNAKLNPANISLSSELIIKV